MPRFPLAPDLLPGCTVWMELFNGTIWGYKIAMRWGDTQFEDTVTPSLLKRLLAQSIGISVSRFFAGISWHRRLQPWPPIVFIGRALDNLKSIPRRLPNLLV